MVAVVMCVLFPSFAQAEQIMEQSAVRLNDDIVLYTVTFDFGFLNADVWMPVGAVRNSTMIGKPPVLGYSFYNESKEAVEEGNSYSVVLSDAPLIDGAYFIPERTRATFTLLTLLQLPRGNDMAEQDISLQVTSLPHIIKRASEDDTFIRQLSKVDLEAYHTETVSF